ncbi:MAG: tryptophan--tRNA ligase [Firmicutes bacterium]|nr:tryptophan--tRNA ligase [Bacillota bacterium]
MEKDIILTGDRPTGSLHVGHFVGSLKQRVEMQESGKYKQYIMIADLQALTDNAENPQKIRDNIMEVMLDYLAVGLDPKKTTIFIQSQIPALYELPLIYSNLVTLARLQRNPTVKTEMKQKGYGANVPVGFLTYPISQAADITAFGAKYVPVGEDQVAVIEQTHEIVKSFNRIYNTDILVYPNAVLSKNKKAMRLVGTDGNAKMSKSLGNCIYIKDSEQTIKQKVMGMFTDPNHLKVEDKGNTKNNPVFTYLDVFSTDQHFAKHLPEYKNLNELKAHYERGGLGDMKVKNFLNQVMQDVLRPVRERREQLAKDKKALLKILEDGTKEAIKVSNKILEKVRSAVGITYFDDQDFLNKL